MVEEGLIKYNSNFKMWLIKSQLYEQINHIDKARETYEDAIKQEVVKLIKQVWICYSDFEIG
jgi:hypothetical protein